MSETDLLADLIEVLPLTKEQELTTQAANFAAAVEQDVLRNMEADSSPLPVAQDILQAPVPAASYADEVMT